MDVVKKLNKLRLERNMSVYRLAELSGINQSTLANTFSRGTVPSVFNLEIMCETLGCTLAQFFTEDEEYMELTPQEIKFMLNYRRLPESIKLSIADIVNTIPGIQN
ncbi:MAG: helix-turn-helix transcriptional regulator [Clostridia bacterium]|nr:helix-turn-helix transcriptional regulator [Clostridia bacterium]